MADTKKMALSWLNHAHAMEVEVGEILDKNIDQANDFPELKDKLTEHAKTTHKQAARIKKTIERLGGDVSSVKSGLAGLMGKATGIPAAMADDEVIHNTAMNFAIENYEIAVYSALIPVLDKLGDEDAINTVETILDEEDEMSQWLDLNLQTIVEQYLDTSSKK